MKYDIFTCLVKEWVHYKLIVSRERDYSLSCGLTFYFQPVKLHCFTEKPALEDGQEKLG
jgi:hypothetical protein